MSDGNIALVQKLYAAFANGDIAAIVRAGTHDIDWAMVGSHSDYPGFVAKKGQVGVQEFFRDVADNWNFEEFSPQEFYAADDKVFVLGHSTATLKRNGRRVASDWVHVFTIRNGEVAKFREFNDSAQIAAAWSG